MTNDQRGENSEEEIISVESRPPTQKEIFYLDWVKDLIKAQFSLCNEVLKQIITLCLALLSVSVIFDKLFEKDPSFKFFTVLMFFIALICACVGIYPFESNNLWFDSPSDIERFKSRALNFKKLWYKLSSVFLLLGIGTIVYAVLRQVYHL